MYPSDLQYKHAVMNKYYPQESDGYIFDPIIANQEVIYSAGRFSCVFKVKKEDNHDVKAIKLFTLELAGRFERYKSITRHLKKLNSNFLVNIEFVPNLIYVNQVNLRNEDNYFPGLIMDWAEGITLGTQLKILCDNRDNKSLKKIARNFKELAFFLIQSPIGHGDLKHDNIIVNEDLELILVDYDGVFTPDFIGQKSHEIGTDSFQHPSRKESDFNDRIDEFSILTIYTSLLALSVNPELYEEFNEQQNLLFTKSDFLNSDSSKLLHKLDNINETKALSFLIRQSLKNGSIYIDNLIDILNGNYPIPELTINHLPIEPFIDENIIITWRSTNTDFVNIDGTDKSANGNIQMQMPRNLNLDIVYGNNYNRKRLNYKVIGIPKPEILEFSIDNQIIKYDPEKNYGEAITVKTKAINFIKAELILDENIIDVSRQNKISIAGVIKNTNVIFRLYSKRDSYTVEQSILVEVYNPVKLTVKQNKKIIFPGRLVTISIESEKANKVTLQPFNIDLTGKKEYNLAVDRDTTCTIIAENKRYSESQSFRVEVIKLVEYPRQIIRLSDIQFNVPLPNFLRFNKKEELLKLEREDLFAKKFNMIMDKLNMFKVISKIKYK